MQQSFGGTFPIQETAENVDFIPSDPKRAAEKRPDTHSLLKGKRIVVAILLLVALPAVAKGQPHSHGHDS